MPGFERAYFVGLRPPDRGCARPRLLEGEYVVTRQDVADRVHFHDSVCRGRDYYTPYRALLPVGVDQLLVAGRHYSATRQAQKMSRGDPALQWPWARPPASPPPWPSPAASWCGTWDVRAIQKRMRAQGADPGDRPAGNALVTEAA